MGLFASIKKKFLYHYSLHRVNHLPYGCKGTNVILFNGSIFHPTRQVYFGNNIYVGPKATFWAHGGIKLGDNIAFGPNVTIYTSNHRIHQTEYLPFDLVSEVGQVHVHSNVWVGAQCIILAGVTIGEGAVCAAGSVISKDVPPLAIVAGNPARVVRYRDPEHYMRLKRENKFLVPLIPQPYTYTELQKSPSLIAHSERAKADYDNFQMDRYEFEE